MEIYTPTHVVLAFEQAMKELEQEGGIQARHAQEMYTYIKERGYAIYPGKLTDVDTFRIGVIGEIYEEDIWKLTEIMKSYMEQA